jgi:hypothetical protein
MDGSFPHHSFSSMKTIALAIAAIFCIAPSARAADPPPPSIAVTLDGAGKPTDPEPYPRILMAVWPDGRIVWSEDQKKGGPPFRTATVKAASLEENLAKFEKAAVFEKEKKSFRHSWYGPDSTYHSIWLCRGDKHTRIETWHELFEANPNLVVINGGITSLNGRKREDVIASDTKEFQAFRKLWTELRTSTSALIPKEGKPFTEPLKLKLPR